MHANADGGCTDSVRQPALEVDSLGKNFLAALTGTRTRVSIAPGFFSRTLYPLNYPQHFDHKCFVLITISVVVCLQSFLPIKLGSVYLSGQVAAKTALLTAFHSILNSTFNLQYV